VSFSFTAALHAVLMTLIAEKFQTVNPGRPLSQPHTLVLRQLFDETFAQIVFAGVTSADVAQYSTSMLTRCRIFLQILYELLRRNVACCVFLPSPNLDR